MRPGEASRTAVMVCIGRAMADGTERVAGFSDPTALTLLPDEERARVERLRGGPRGLRERAQLAFYRKQAQIMALRTLTIDRAVRQAGAPQLVILGAGLDGRAWRMAELAETVVFEIDHPDSQREKRARVAGLRQTAREVRFVPVDFEHDVLADALATAGHDPRVPTTWIWEGVVMYLAAADIERTLAVVAARSAPGSRLVILYHRPSLLLGLVGLIVRRLGEPLRSAHTAGQMRALLARHGFTVVGDQSMAEAGGAVSAAMARQLRGVNHLRVVVADRQRSAT